MSAKHSIPLRKELHALALVDAKQPLRLVSKIIGVPKSTIHDNLDNYRSDVKAFERQQLRLDRDLVRDILIISMEGKTSSRDCANILSKQRGFYISHNKVLSTLSEMGTVAQKKNSPQVPLHSVTSSERPYYAPLSQVKCGAFDEIFQKQNPILGFVDPVSDFIFFQEAINRSAESWEEFLLVLRKMGLDVSSTVTDGGLGMLKAISKVFPNAIQMRDLYHVLSKLSKALKALENKCYHLIRLYDKQIKNKKKDDKNSPETAQSLMNKAIQIFDDLEKECKIFKSACYFENESGYVSSVKIAEMMKNIIALIDEAKANDLEHSKLKDAKNYLQNSQKEIVAYKATIEKLVEVKYGKIYAEAVLGYICPIIEGLDQIQRSYENLKRKDYWEKKVLEARAKFHKFNFINQDEVNIAINDIAQVMNQIKKSNSLIENVNSIVRRFLVTYKSIPSWFCSLFTFYWNHRRFPRGKRKGLKPIEVLTGVHSELDWIDELLDGHVFQDEKPEEIFK